VAGILKVISRRIQLFLGRQAVTDVARIPFLIFFVSGKKVDDNVHNI
jgi:hypothetical protein